MGIDGWKKKCYLTDEGPHEGLPQPVVALVGHLHLLPHDLRRCHRTLHLPRRVRSAVPGRPARLVHRPHGRRPPRLQPQRLLYPAVHHHHPRPTLRPATRRRPVPAALQSVVIERASTATKAGGRAARHEEEFVGGLAEVGPPEGLEPPEWALQLGVEVDAPLRPGGRG